MVGINVRQTSTTKSDTVSYTEREMLKKRLLEQIEAEERLVRIYEADIQVTANSQTPPTIWYSRISPNDFSC
jgi:hypothetical protein